MKTLKELTVDSPEILARIAVEDAGPELLAAACLAVNALNEIYDNRTKWHGDLAALEAVSVARKTLRAAIALATKDS